MKISKFKLFIVFTIFIGSLTVSYAQTINNETSIKVSPANPEPGQQMTFLLQNTSIDVNRSKITWQLNGQDQKVGIGLKNYYLIAAEAGKTQKITAVVDTKDGQSFTSSINIVPASVDLTYESITYTPPFYRGKSLSSNQSDLVFVAFPELYDETGRKYNTSELQFQWLINDTVAGEGSGVGKNYLYYTNQIPPRDTSISVTVTAPNQKISATKSIEIIKVLPQVILYENSPIYGLMLNKAINRPVQLQSDEFSLVAFPYHFSVGYPTVSNLKYSWLVNNKAASTQEISNIFNLRQESKGSGTAKIGIKIQNQSRFFQSAEGASTINFNKE